MPGGRLPGEPGGRRVAAAAGDASDELRNNADKAFQMVHNVGSSNSLLNVFINQLRDVNKQSDRLRFRRNLERIGEIMAYEISKTMPYRSDWVDTPLGRAVAMVPTKRLVLATIFRAGIPLHQGLLNYFDDAENAFVSAYRKNHKDGHFEIALEYISCPDLNDSILLVADPMLATGASMQLAIEGLLRFGRPDQLHIVTAIGAKQGVDHIRRTVPEATIWLGALDDELTAKSYIVPGLGDAGDLAYGPKVQE
ncbi:MAG: uracil phosphoribosyltransferase [Bacteroidota bacterium]|jgi:uracil phosphoribosyltransferase